MVWHAAFVPRNIDNECIKDSGPDSDTDRIAYPLSDLLERSRDATLDNRDLHECACLVGDHNEAGPDSSEGQYNRHRQWVVFRRHEHRNGHQTNQRDNENNESPDHQTSGMPEGVAAYDGCHDGRNNRIGNSDETDHNGVVSETLLIEQGHN